MDSFFCILFLRRLHSGLTVCYLINYTLKELHFSMKRCSVRFLSKTLTSKRLAENWRQHDVKTSKMCKTTFPIPVGFAEIPVGYTRKNERAHVKRVLTTWANSEGSSEPVHLHSLTRAFNVRSHMDQRESSDKEPLLWYLWVPAHARLKDKDLKPLDA